MDINTEDTRVWPAGGIPAPITRILDHYSQTVTPWVRIERADGSRETVRPEDAELLEFVNAANAYDPFNTPQPSPEQALGRAILADAGAEEIYERIRENRVARGLVEDDPGECSCNGVNNPNGCPVCRAELETGEIPFQI